MVEQEIAWIIISSSFVGFFSVKLLAWKYVGSWIEQEFRLKWNYITNVNFSFIVL